MDTGHFARWHFFSRDYRKMTLDQKMECRIVHAPEIPGNESRPKSFGSRKACALYFLSRRMQGAARYSYGQIAQLIHGYFPGTETMPGELNRIVRMCRRGEKGYGHYGNMPHRHEVPQ